ncbi:MAG: hypothetical protein JWO94_3387 [Verrucomicrobiaceae bacterium]|nr:hypothetical protein [Verrucomicrobiaceae bacterium]
MTDTIIEEVREARAALAAEFDYDIGRIIAWAQAQEAAERETRQRGIETALLSEPSLAKDWNRPGEDEARAYLQ